MSDASKDHQSGRVKEVTSTSNPIVKEIKGLFLKKNRDTSGLFIAEGLKLVTDALETGWKIKTLIFTKNHAAQNGLQEIAARCKASGSDILEVSDKVLTAISRRDNPQTIIGVFHQTWSTAEEIANRANENSDVIVALDRVRDPGNLGTILRTCDAVGVKGVMLIGNTTDPFSIEATRATMGSIFHVPLARLTEEEFANWKKNFKGRVAGTHLEGAVDYRSVDWDASPTLLLMGNEQQGLTEALADCCDDVMIIPMAGKTDSLNLAIATGIMLFEIRRGVLSMEGHSIANQFDKKPAIR